MNTKYEFDEFMYLRFGSTKNGLGSNLGLHMGKLETCIILVVRGKLPNWDFQGVRSYGLGQDLAWTFTCEFDPT